MMCKPIEKSNGDWLLPAAVWTSRPYFTELMMRTDEIATDVGSIIDGEEAVSLGVIDEVGGLAAALAALRGMIEAGEE